MTDTYTMFHCHTDYSLLDSVTKPKEYVELAVENGMKALSFSEHGKPLNWTEKYGLCKEAGIKYMHSCEIYLTETLEEKIRDNYHTVLIAKNMEGLREINTLINRAFSEDHFYYTGRLSFEEFLNISDNIISTSACLASPLNKLPVDHPMYMALANKYDFLEVQPHLHIDQIKFNQHLLELSKKINKPLIVGTDTHSSSKYKADCRAILLKAKYKTYGDEDAFDLSFKTYNELVEMFVQQGVLSEQQYIDALENTNILAEMCEEITLDTSIKYPILYGDRETDSKKFDDEVQEKFHDKCLRGIISKDQIKNFEDSIQEESRVFKKLNMEGFMLSMGELVSWCKNNGMAIGTSRGSVGGSRIAYILDIIDLNPETWHTVFSRFANEDREEIGDIDIDVVKEDRPAIFQYIIERFGRDKTARVASFGTLKSDAAIDEIGRALAIKWEEEHKNIQLKVDGNTARKITKFSPENPWNLNAISRIKKSFAEDPEWTKENYDELFYYYDGLLDVKVSQSVHPAGMVISPITLPDNYGVFLKDGEDCLLLDMDNVHDWTGLAKYDFLVLKTVQVIRDACNYLELPYPKTHEIDWDDENVWKSMITSPAMIFQFEGDYAYQCLKKFKPKSIFDMSLVTACIRPTGASYRNELLARRRHKNPSPMIDELLQNNLGYLV